jgi:lysyl-tRNA synthetase class I
VFFPRMPSPAIVKYLLPSLLAVALLAGCSSVSTRKVIALDDFRSIYVERRLNDNNRLDELIVAELQRLGRTASSGPLTMMPEKTDAVLRYTDRWEWDFKTYLIELNIELHTARTYKKLADGRYHQPTIKTKPPAEVIRELLVPLFGPP